MTDAIIPSSRSDQISKASRTAVRSAVSKHKHKEMYISLTRQQSLGSRYCTRVAGELLSSFLLPRVALRVSLFHSVWVGRGWSCGCRIVGGVFQLVFTGLVMLKGVVVVEMSE